MKSKAILLAVTAFCFCSITTASAQTTSTLPEIKIVPAPGFSGSSSAVKTSSEKSTAVRNIESSIHRPAAVTSGNAATVTVISNATVTANQAAPAKPMIPVLGEEIQSTDPKK